MKRIIKFLFRRAVAEIEREAMEAAENSVIVSLRVNGKLTRLATVAEYCALNVLSGQPRQEIVFEVQTEPGRFWRIVEPWRGSMDDLKGGGV